MTPKCSVMRTQTLAALLVTVLLPIAPAHAATVYDGTLVGRGMLTPKAPAEPHLTGAKIFRGRPGRPIRFRVSATGEKAVQLSGTELPVGVTMDPEPVEATPYPNCVKIFDGTSFSGWEADPSTWHIVDGAMQGTGGSSRLAYTKKDYGSFRLIFTSRMDPVNGDHLGLMFWGNRPTDPARPETDGAGWLQFAPPIGWMWDYHPPKGHTPPFERMAQGSKDFTQWCTTEMLCDLEKGTMRAAVDGVELARYIHPYPAERTDPERRILAGPIAVMRHGGGTSIYKDIYVEENPKEDNLITVPSDGNPLSVSIQQVLPGKGLAQHDFLYAGESKSRRAFIIRKGKVVWSYDDPEGLGEISDAVLLSNGNVLLAHQYAVKLISPENKVLWNLDAPPNTEIHTAMPIGLEHVLYVQNGDPAVAKVVNLTDGRTVKEFMLPVGNPKNTHGQFRHARITPAGTLVVAHMDMNKVCEYNADGKEVWSYPVANPWGVTPLKNGTFLITCRSDVREVTRKGETVATITPSDSPDYKLTSLQQAWRLPNGNTLVNTWFSEWSGKVNREDPPVQAVEFTPDKKIVWVLRSWDNPDLGPSTTIQILDEPQALENVSFGDIK